MGVEAWMEPCAWGRELVVTWPARDGEDAPHLAAVVYDAEGLPLQPATTHVAALRTGDRWVARLLVNSIASDVVVASVDLDRVERRVERRRLDFTVPAGGALDVDVPVGEGVTLRRVSLAPGPEPGTHAARVVVERTGAGAVEVSAEVGYVRGNTRSGTQRFTGPGVAVIEVEDLEVPPDASRISVAVESAGPARATPMGGVPVGPPPTAPALAPVGAPLVGTASLDDQRFTAQVAVPVAPGTLQVTRRLWADGVPVWTEERRPEVFEPVHVRIDQHLRLPVPRSGTLVLELVTRAVEVHAGVVDVVVPEAPAPPRAVPHLDAVGPVRVLGAWSYAEDRPDIGRYRGVRLLLRNTSERQLALSFRFVQSGQNRGVGSGGDLAPGAADLFDLSDDTPAGGYRAELQVTSVGDVVHHGVLPVVRFT